MTFIFNRWVRGEDFVGRVSLLQRIFEKKGSSLWILGNRRVGKTSLLRQVEWLCKKGKWKNTEALYWDLQGAGSAQGLKDSFLESLEDNEALSERLDLDIEELEDLSFPELMNKFRRKTKSLDHAGLLLLIDECEELVDIAREEAFILPSFRKLTHTQSLGLVMAGSLRMMDLDESGSRTSPFLPDFLPPLPLHPFDPEESLTLLSREGIDADDGRRIHDLCFGNPHLLQVIGEHFSRLGNLQHVLAELHATRVCHYFFQSNFQCLPPAMADWWREGKILDALAGLATEDPNFAYAVQSSLLRFDGEGRVETSPLLEMTVAGNLPKGDNERGSAPSKPQSGKGEKQADAAASTAAHFFKALSERGAGITVLPEVFLKKGTPEAFASVKKQLSLRKLAEQEAPPKKLHTLLDGASPEYVLGEAASARTAVYLAGLCLYRYYFGFSPFREIEDPWQRANAIAERDVSIPVDHGKPGLSPKKAMVLLRSLKARPDQRYDSLESLARDLAD